jgi:hypothetical protein
VPPGAKTSALPPKPQRPQNAHRPAGELFSPHGEIKIHGDHEPACPQLDQICKNGIEVAFGPGVQTASVETRPFGSKTIGSLDLI